MLAKSRELVSAKNLAADHAATTSTVASKAQAKDYTPPKPSLKFVPEILEESRNMMKRTETSFSSR